MNEDELDAQCKDLWLNGLRTLRAFCARTGATDLEIEESFVRLISARKMRYGTSRK